MFDSCEKIMIILKIDALTEHSLNYILICMHSDRRHIDVYLLVYYVRSAWTPSKRVPIASNRAYFAPFNRIRDLKYCCFNVSVPFYEFFKTLIRKLSVSQLINHKRLFFKLAMICHFFFEVVKSTYNNKVPYLITQASNTSLAALRCSNSSPLLLTHLTFYVCYLRVLSTFRKKIGHVTHVRKLHR